MACPAVLTGNAFLASALAHIDCQAQAIGSYGFGALASPGSPVTVALTSLLTVFVALFGIRLLLGYPMAPRDVVGDVLKVGIVLTLATSWPAWRVVGYDLVIDGPNEFAEAIGASAGIPGSAGDLADRLQNVDKGLAALNSYGSGRLGVAQGDWFQLGFARVAFLVGTLGPLALVRLVAGVLLAITPLMACLLLFGVTRGLFEGWARGLAMTLLASIFLSLVYGVELALLEPWLQDALQKRVMDAQILDAPVEGLVATLSFAVVTLAGVFLIARMAFHGPFRVTTLAAPLAEKVGGLSSRLFPRPSATRHEQEPSRALTVANSVTESLRREERFSQIDRTASRWSQREGAAPAVLAAESARRPHEPSLGSTWRRQSRRTSTSAQRRDNR